MRNASITNRSALKSLKPSTPNDKRSIRKIAIYGTALAALVALLFFLKHEDLAIRERTWTSTTATIKDGRPKLATQGVSQYSGIMLYQPEILIQYSDHGVTQQKWVTLGDQPHSITDVKFKIFRLKGTTCTVRWKPNEPNVLIAEAS